MESEKDDMEARKMTPEEHERGWVILACEEHIWVWRAALVKDLPEDAIEFCDSISGPAIKREVLDKEFVAKIREDK
jgi:hypothetical protein